MNSGFIYKTEAHCHTHPVSRCSSLSPEDMVKLYKEAGYSAIVITNHFRGGYDTNEYIEGYERSKKIGNELGINVILGMELTFDNIPNDYLIYGIDESDVERIALYTDKDIKTFYDGFKNDKNVILQAHPFRDGMMEVPPRYIDGIEAFNMCDTQNSRVALAALYAEKHKDFIAIGGSDCHRAGHHALCATITETVPKDSFEFAEILKTKAYKLQMGDFIINIKKDETN